MRLVCDETEDRGAGAARMPAPLRPEDLAAHYDLTMSHPELDAVSYTAFERWLAQEAATLDLYCALIHDGTVRQTIRRLAAGEMTIGYHLDYHALWHQRDDTYARLAEAVQDAGGRPVNAPARSRAFTDKAVAHAELLRHGLGVPATILFRPATPDRPLQPNERRALQVEGPGARLFIKPGNGYGGRGVISTTDISAESFVRTLAAARQYDREDTYLVQRGVRPPLLRCDDGVERPAYWRVLGCLGDLIPFWWSPLDHFSGRPCYHRLVPEEVRRHRLQPVLDYARAVGDLSGLEWYSTELCLSDGSEVSRFVVTGPDGDCRPVVAIDYLNDQCDMDVQSRWLGAPPDDVVRHVARRFAAEAARLRQAKVAPPRIAA